MEEKLRSLGLHYEFIPNVCVQLSEEGYLNEERFVSAYVRGKFNRNKWGKVKITQGLKQKKIGEYLIRKGMQEIDEDRYEERIKDLIASKANTLSGTNPREDRGKIYRYLLQKGYEPDRILTVLNTID